jgi:hypothetical protein
MTAMVLLSINAAERSGSDDSVPRAYTVMGGLTGLLRAGRLSARYFAKAHEVAELRQDLSERAMALAVEIVMKGSLGRWHDCRRAAAPLRELLPELADPLIRQNVVTTLRHVEFFGGRYDAARAHALDLLSAARVSGNRQHTMWGLYFVARSACEAGEFAAAVPLLREACATLATHVETQSEINCIGLLALAELRAGSVDEAHRLADDALARIARSRPTGFPSLDGFSAVATVYRELSTASRGDDDGAAAARWRAVRQALWRFALMYPVALPTALYESGQAQAAAGRTRLARLLFRLSSRYARRYSMAAELAAAERAATV